MAPTKNLKPLKDPKTMAAGYTPSGEEAKVHKQYLRRKRELLNSRRNVFGQDIDMLMRKWDKNYFNRVADIPASELDPDQKPIAINNAFGKVQTALGLLIDKNPEITLDESNPRYTANRELIKGLTKASWKNTNSLGQLKLSIFNCAKRGWFVGRTFHRCLKHDARFLSRVEDEETDATEPEYDDTSDTKAKLKGKKKEKRVYDIKEVTKLDDIAYMNINNYNAWLDEQTVPEDFYSTRDWMWREVWHIDDVKRIFPEAEFPNMQFVTPGGDTRETIEGVQNQATGAQTTANEAKETKEGMTELFFYENQYDDWFIVEIHGVMVVWEPLPQNSKRLSCTYGYWNLRAAETIYGIGVVEEMETNDKVADRILNMSLRQLLLTIAPPGFFTGTEDPEDENLKYSPGILRRTLDPKNITFLNIPPGNKDAQFWLPWLEEKQDSMTGISKTLEGEMTNAQDNPTAFELGISREAGLKRLRLPLKTIQYALNWEFQNRIALIKQVYSDFTVEHIADPADIMEYLDEVKADKDLFFIENEGTAGHEKFYKKNYREVQLSVQQDEKGNFIESEDKKFFKIKPQYLAFEGEVTVEADTLLVSSEELEKADTLRMSNILVPLLQMQPDMIARPVKQILLAFNKDPQKWLPDTFLKELAKKKDDGSHPGNASAAPLAPPGGAPAPGGTNPPAPEIPPAPTMPAPAPAPAAPTVIPQNSLNGNPSLGQRASAAYDAFKRGT